MFPMQGGQPASKLYADDVFSTYLYNGTGAAQTISNGIDLAGNGGMVWIKCRTTDATYGLHRLFDTARGVTKYLNSALTNAEATDTGSVTSFSSTGFSLKVDAYVNRPGNIFTSWTFRKALKFFDVVTYTGDGTVNRAIAHNLTQAPGTIIVKATTGTESWHVWHRSLSYTAGTGGNTGKNLYSNIILNEVAAQTADGNGFSGNYITPHDASSFYVPSGVGAKGNCNTTGVTYVAYLFSHDAGADGLIQCGSYTGNGSTAGPTVTLGWEPQFLLAKNATSTGSWQLLDCMRGMDVGFIDASLQANSSAAESSVDVVSPTATGFQMTSSTSDLNTNGATCIYVAIRRPNKPPTTGTQVFVPVARYGTNNTEFVNAAGIPVDMVMIDDRYNSYSSLISVVDRLRGAFRLSTNSTGAESAAVSVSFASMQGYRLNGGSPDNASTAFYVDYAFRRAPGFFDVVCYTGTGSATTVAHNLGVAPELMIVKARTTTSSIEWYVFHSTLGTSGFIQLNSTGANIVTPGFWSSTPTASGFTPCNYQFDNAVSYVAYLFATCPGVSKVGSYTGNGSSQTINCGFTTGARFILIKRTDSAGDWYVWDSARGIVASNDPHLSLNTTALEVSTDDSVDPDNSGFIVNQVAATNVNVSAATYIYLAIA